MAIYFACEMTDVMKTTKMQDTNDIYFPICIKTKFIWKLTLCNIYARRLMRPKKKKNDFFFSFINDI